MIRILILIFSCAGIIAAQPPQAVQSVANQAELVALNPNGKQTMILTNGGGTFIYVAASVTSTNSSTVFKPALYPGRWHQINSGGLLTKEEIDSQAEFEALLFPLPSGGGGTTPQLSAGASAGATSVTLNQIPDGLGANLGYIVIEPWSINCEIRQVSSVVGNVVNVTGAAAYPLTFAHSSGTKVMAISGVEAIPWNLFGGKPNTTDTADVTNNVAGFNRLSTNLYNLTLRGPARIFIPAGYWYVDNQLEPERDIGLIGASVNTAVIAAADDFPFTTSGEVAIIHPKRDGLPVVYATPGPSGRWFMKDFLVTGRSLANSCGILSSPQQPDSWSNIRVDECKGLYGICLADVQQHKMENIELVGNAVALRLRSASFVFIDTLNIEQTTISECISEFQGGGGGGCNNNRIENFHIECVAGASSHLFDLAGNGWSFENGWFTNLDDTRTGFKFQTSAGSFEQGPVYHLKGIKFNQPSVNFKLIDDVDRAYVRTNAHRWIPDLFGAPHPLAGDVPSQRFIGLNGDLLDLGPQSISGGYNIKSVIGTSGAEHFGAINASGAKVFAIANSGAYANIMAVDDLAYNAGTWDGSTNVPTRNAVRDQMELKANIASPTFAGNPAAPTPSAGDNDTSIATTGFVQTEIDATQSGTHASPSTTNPLSPTWSGPCHTVWYGVAGTINLPAASGYTGRAILIYNTGAFTVTIDPNGSEVIVRDGNVQTGGVTFTLSSGAGNYVALVCDGARWITLGYKGTLTLGT